MAAIMKQCDFAISAAGTTLYELSAIGVPTISITFADNQLIMAETFHETDAIPYAGDLRNTVSTSVTQASQTKEDTNSLINTSIKETQNLPVSMNEATLHNVISLLKDHIDHFDRRKKLHSNMKSLVNSDGASIIANSLCQLA